jgi:hypothetical protein
MPDLAVEIRCACGAKPYVLTCHNFRGSGHEWAIAVVCMFCHDVHWTKTGCLDCKEEQDG